MRSFRRALQGVWPGGRRGMMCVIHSGEEGVRKAWLLGKLI